MILKKKETMSTMQIPSTCVLHLVFVLLIASSPTIKCETVQNGEISDTLVVIEITEDITNEESITIQYERLNYATESDIHMYCSTTRNMSSVDWLNPSGESLSGEQFNNTRFSCAQGWLNITNSHVNDTGDYTCIDTQHPNLNETLKLEIYIMPDYFIAGMVILSINVALVVLFFLCLCYKTAKERQANKKYEKYQNSPEIHIVEDMNTSDPSKPNFKPHNKHLDL